MTNLLTTITEEALKRFDKLMGQKEKVFPHMGSVVVTDSKELTYRVIKGFLLDELSLALETVKKKVEKMKRYRTGKPQKHEFTDCTCGYGHDDCECDFNEALDQVLTLLDTQKKEKV